MITLTVTDLVAGLIDDGLVKFDAESGRYVRG